jgi:hypothetical protein
VAVLFPKSRRWYWAGKCLNTSYWYVELFNGIGCEVMEEKQEIDKLLSKLITLLDKEIALTKSDLQIKTTKPPQISCHCSFLINGKKQTFPVYGTKDEKLFAIYNAELIEAFTIFQYQNQATDLRKRLRGQAAIAIKKQIGSRNLEKYGIDTLAIAQYLGARPSINHEIDHIIPLANFDFHSLNQIKEAFAPSNHQWLLRKEHEKKTKKEMRDYYERR